MKTNPWFPVIWSPLRAMTMALPFKILVILMLAVIFASLASGLIFLVRDKGKSDRTVKSLTWRIALSIVLFVLLFIGYALGLVQPHGGP